VPEETRWDRNLSVASDGEGLIGHAGAVLLGKLADQCGLTALSRALARAGKFIALIYRELFPSSRKRSNRGSGTNGKSPGRPLIATAQSRTVRGRDARSGGQRKSRPGTAAPVTDRSWEGSGTADRGP
jgi:hypothetical protein